MFAQQLVRILKILKLFFRVFCCCARVIFLKKKKKLAIFKHFLGVFSTVMFLDWFRATFWPFLQKKNWSVVQMFFFTFLWDFIFFYFFSNNDTVLQMLIYIGINVRQFCCAIVIF